MSFIARRLLYIIIVLSCIGVLSIFLIIFLTSVFVVSEITNTYNQNLRYKPIAVNIDTKNITNRTSHENQLFINLDAQPETILINTGQSVQTAIQMGNVANITGGPLGNNTFIYQSFTYYWASNSTGVTGTTVDGKGVPYEVRVLFLNNKYTKISQAVQYEDGLAELVFRFNICSTINQPFDQLSQYIRNITTFASFVPVPLGTHFKAVEYQPTSFPQSDDLLSMDQYYSYAGLFLDTATGKKYNCSTVISLFDLQNCCMTEDQFNQTFIPLKDSVGNPLFNTLNYDSSAVQASLYTGFAQGISNYDAN